MMSSNLKNILFGAAAVLLVIVFALAFKNVMLENSQKEMKALQDIKKSAENNEKAANIKRDSVISQNKILYMEMGVMKGQIMQNNKNINRLSDRFENSINDLKLTHEKDYVPDNAPIDEQSDFITKYRYREYTGSANP